jgi:hypothetical protein
MRLRSSLLLLATFVIGVVGDRRPAGATPLPPRFEVLNLEIVSVTVDGAAVTDLTAWRNGRYVRASFPEGSAVSLVGYVAGMPREESFERYTRVAR